MNLSYTRTRGKHAGLTLLPHKHDDGMYVASKTRFEKDYIRVPTIDQLIPHMQRGLAVRMSAPGVAPSLIRPESIRIER